MAKVLITGGKGQLGQSIQKIVRQYPQHELVLLSRSDLDVLNLDQIHRQFEIHKPEIVIHAAAFTAVDLAETEQTLCFEINVTGTRNIARYTQQYGAVFFYISSDYVYHASGQNLISEKTEPKPKGIYAQSKLRGEWEALSSCNRTIIIRTAWVYSEYGHNFLKTMSRLMKAGKDLKVVHDQIGTPTYAPHLAETLLAFISNPKVSDSFIQEVYNYADAESLSWHAFALRIRDYLNLNNQINPCTTEEYGAAAARPENSRLDSSKILTLLSLPRHDLNTGINASLAI